MEERISIVGIGAATEGAGAIARVVSALGLLKAPILVVQHLHPDFVANFTRWLAQQIGAPAELARDGITPEPGGVYVAPPRAHLRLASRGHITVGPAPESAFRPSIDELFQSLAMSAGESAAAALLTPSEHDGETGLTDVARAGGLALAEEHCELPSVAGIRMLPLEEIAAAIRGAAGTRRRS